MNCGIHIISVIVKTIKLYLLLLFLYELNLYLMRNANFQSLA